MGFNCNVLLEFECLSNSAEPTPASKLYISTFYGHKAGFPLAIFSREANLFLCLWAICSRGFFFILAQNITFNNIHYLQILGLGTY